MNISLLYHNVMLNEIKDYFKKIEKQHPDKKYSFA